MASVCRSLPNTVENQTKRNRYFAGRLHAGWEKTGLKCQKNIT